MTDNFTNDEELVDEPELSTDDELVEEAELVDDPELVEEPDVTTEAVNDQDPTGAEGTPSVGANSPDLADTLRERTEDLQRLQAEYVNYKRRVDRDRQVSKQNGIESVLRDLMPVFDSIVEARKHDDLTGGFKLTADEFEKVANRYGLKEYGKPGDVFDPQIHDALMQQPVAGTGEPHIHEVIQSGFSINDQVVRPARVVVAMPDGSADPTAEAATEQDTQSEEDPSSES